MTRIFSTLAALNALLLLAAFVVGVVSKLSNAVEHPDVLTYLIHFYLGLIDLGTLPIHRSKPPLKSLRPSPIAH